MTTPLSADDLYWWLRARDVVVLAVVPDTDGYVVYLHGPAGEINFQQAFSLLTRLDTLAEVRVADHSPWILRVRHRRAASERP
jgi:hypothetical protein